MYFANICLIGAALFFVLNRDALAIFEQEELKVLQSFVGYWTELTPRKVAKLPVEESEMSAESEHFEFKFNLESTLITPDSLKLLDPYSSQSAPTKKLKNEKNEMFFAKIKRVVRNCKTQQTRTNINNNDIWSEMSASFFSSKVLVKILARKSDPWLALNIKNKTLELFYFNTEDTYKFVLSLAKTKLNAKIFQLQGDRFMQTLERNFIDDDKELLKLHNNGLQAIDCVDYSLIYTSRLGIGFMSNYINDRQSAFAVEKWEDISNVSSSKPSATTSAYNKKRVSYKSKHEKPSENSEWPSLPSKDGKSSLSYNARSSDDAKSSVDAKSSDDAISSTDNKVVQKKLVHRKKSFRKP